MDRDRTRSHVIFARKYTDVDYYNYQEPPRSRLIDILTNDTATIIMAADCDATVPEAMRTGPFPLIHAEVIDLSGCINLDGPTLAWILRAPQIRLVGLLAIDNLFDIVMNESDSVLFQKKAVYLPAYKLTDSCSIDNHLEFYRIIQEAFIQQ